MSPAVTSSRPNGLPIGNNAPRGLPDGSIKARSNGANGERVFAPIGELLNAQPGESKDVAMRKLLEAGERYAAQAETLIDFRRPDNALEEYVRAFIIATQVIPHSREWPDLQSSTNGDLHRRYTKLCKRITTQEEKFEKVKEAIKENNRRHGVPNGAAATENRSLAPNSLTADEHSLLKSARTQTTQTFENKEMLKDSTASVANGSHYQPQYTKSKPNGDSTSFTSQGGSPKKTTKPKPPVLPKPHQLQGNSVTTSNPAPHPSSSTSAETGLAARFARLRTAESPSPPITQDPRIRTRPIPSNLVNDSLSVKANQNGTTTPPVSDRLPARPGRPLGPRDMPSAPTGLAPRSTIPLDVQVPQMPRAPDAVYSPSRNSDLIEPSSLLQSTQRNSFGPSRMADPMAATSSASRDYFSSGSSFSGTSAQTSSASVKFPEASTVSAEELVQYLKKGSAGVQTLLVDIRGREDFDSGHIMSQSIVCIEPLVLRKELSAEELAESLVLSPEHEQRLFDQRHDFDLVVFYDQDSATTGTTGQHGSSGVALHNFRRAVYDFGYEKQLKREPVLLKGGLDSWVDLMGQGALQSSQTISLPSGQVTNRAKNKNLQKPSIGPRKYGMGPTGVQKQNTAKRLSVAEEEKWTRELQKEADEANESFYTQSKEEFLRRYPDPSAIKESMSSAGPVLDETSSSGLYPRMDGYHSHAQSGIIHDTNFGPLVPQALTRPAPAVPRPSFNGVLQPYGMPIAASATSTPMYSPQQARVNAGMVNPSAQCFLNAAVQCLIADRRPWNDFLLSPEVGLLQPPPKKANESSAPPVLLVKMLANLARHMYGPNARYPVNPRTFANYIRCIHRPGDMANGFCHGGVHHDSSEFLRWLIVTIQDELNQARDQIEPQLNEAQKDAEFTKRSDLGVFAAAAESFQDFSQYNREFITPLMGWQRAIRTTCSTCSKLGVDVSPPDILMELPVDEAKRFLKAKGKSDSHKITLYDCFDSFMLPEQVKKRCIHCDGPDKYHTGPIEKRPQGRLHERRPIFTRLPEMLVITLGRITNDNNKQEATKLLMDRVHFELDDLDLTKYVQKIDNESDAVKAKYGNREEYKGPSWRYRCYGIVQHGGERIDKGHYWALKRNGKDWYRYDDSRVTKIDDIKESSQNTIGTTKNSILFFERFRTAQVQATTRPLAPNAAFPFSVSA